MIKLKEVFKVIILLMAARPQPIVKMKIKSNLYLYFHKTLWGVTVHKWMEWIEGHFLGVVVEVYLQAIIYTLHLITINKHVFHMQSVVQEELKAPAKSEN